MSNLENAVRLAKKRQDEINGRADIIEKDTRDAIAFIDEYLHVLTYEVSNEQASNRNKMILKNIKYSFPNIDQSLIVSHLNKRCVFTMGYFSMLVLLTASALITALVFISMSFGEYKWWIISIGLTAIACGSLISILTYDNSRMWWFFGKRK